MNYQMEDTGSWEVHPAGQFSGIIYDVEDMGICRNRFYERDPDKQKKFKHMIRIKLENSLMESPRKEDGSPFMVWQEYLLSGSKQGNLRPFREKVAGRELTDEEAYNFDDSTLVGVRVGYVITHKPREGRDPWPKIDTVWRLDDNQQTRGEPVGARAPSLVDKQAKAKEEGRPIPGADDQIPEGPVYAQDATYNPPPPPLGHPTLGPPPQPQPPQQGPVVTDDLPF